MTSSEGPIFWSPTECLPFNPRTRQPPTNRSRFHKLWLNASLSPPELMNVSKTAEGCFCTGYALCYDSNSLISNVDVHIKIIGLVWKLCETGGCVCGRDTNNSYTHTDEWSSFLDTDHTSVSPTSTRQLHSKVVPLMHVKLRWRR